MAGGFFVDPEAAGRVSVTGDAALFFAPPQHRDGPGGPAFIFESVRTGIGLVVEIEQAYMAERLRAEAAYFEIVLKHRKRLTQVAGFGLKELPLIAETRAPGQDGANVQTFAFDL